MNNPLVFIDPLGLQWGGFEAVIFPAIEVRDYQRRLHLSGGREGIFEPLDLSLMFSSENEPGYDPWSGRSAYFDPAKSPGSAAGRGPHVGRPGPALSGGTAGGPMIRTAPPNHTHVSVRQPPPGLQLSLATSGTLLFYSWGENIRPIFGAQQWSGASTALIGASIDLIFGQCGDVFSEYGAGYGSHLGFGALYEGNRWTGIALHIGLTFPPWPICYTYGTSNIKSWP